MMGISSYSTASSSYADLSRMYKQMSSGKRVNSAADDAAGLAIAQKMQVQQNEYDRKSANAADERNALNIQDSSLEMTSSALQRIRELSLQASNGTYGADERNAIQTEVNQLMKFIGQDKASELGLQNGIDVTSGSPDITAIDDALKSIASKRGDIGAEYNGKTRQINAWEVASENTADSLSRIIDLDYGSMFNQLSTGKTLFQLRMMAQQNQMGLMRNVASRMFGSNL